MTLSPSMAHGQKNWAGNAVEMTRVRGGMCATAAQSAAGIVSENIAHAQGLQARGYMGKKGNKRKTRWRVLSIGGESTLLPYIS